jgi:hypothetical protein
MAHISLLSASDFNNLINCGALRYGYRLVTHPDLAGFGIVNAAEQVAFWDHAGRPFRTLSAVESWLDDHRPANLTTTLRLPKGIAPTSARRRRAFDRAFVTGGAK